MKRKHPLHLSLIGILAAALLLGLGGCSVEETLPAPTPTPAPSAETTAPLEFALPMSEGSLHPLLSTDKVNLTLGGLIWEGLFALDRTFTPQPGALSELQRQRGRSHLELPAPQRCHVFRRDSPHRRRGRHLSQPGPGAHSPALRAGSPASEALPRRRGRSPWS